MYQALEEIENLIAENAAKISAESPEIQALFSQIFNLANQALLAEENTYILDEADFRASQ